MLCAELLFRTEEKLWRLEQTAGVSDAPSISWLNYFASIGKNLLSQVRMISITRGFSWLNMK
jgi:hypothetical protein